MLYKLKIWYRMNRVMKARNIILKESIICADEYKTEDMSKGLSKLEYALGMYYNVLKSRLK